MRIHLDVLGGMAGDMFIAALLDAFPGHEAGLRASIAAMGVEDLVCTSTAHNDGVFRGRRFDVRLGAAAAPAPAPEPARGHHHHDDGHEDHHHAVGSTSHAHTSWRAIRARLSAAPLADGVRSHALAIFGHLADAEARVHGVGPDEVAFHEVGAWDSIADIVGAAHLIASIDAQGWSVSTLPLGSGRVATAHGLLPVPAPATVILLEGFAFVDDGVAGERVTPTGAAILRHLCPPGVALASDPARLGASGVGFGARRLAGVSNCVRALVFDEALAPASTPHRELLVVEFEVDDQSPEDLATGLDHLRAHTDVFDVIQAPVFGKKGRMMMHVRLLARIEGLEAVSAAVFAETTTIGLRHHRVEGAALPREAQTVTSGDRQLRVKVVERAHVRSAKAESDDVRTVATHVARAALRHAAEHAALAPDEVA